MNKMEAIRLEYIEENLWRSPNATPADLLIRTSGHQLRQLLNDVTGEALRYAKEHGMQDQEFHQMLYDSGGIVFELSEEMFDREDRKDPAHRYNFWRPTESPTERIFGTEPLPQLDDKALECLAARYLALPFRVRSVERLIVDGLISSEMYAYGDKTVRRARMRTQMNGKMLAWLSGPDPTPQQLVPLRAMIETSLLMRSNGTISAQFVRERAIAAYDKGAGWPASLFAVLDDVISRGGKL